MNRTIIVIEVIVFIAILVGAVVVFLPEGESKNLDAFATCLKDKGLIFYGAFWCPHCQNQKELFGPSGDLLPYVECSTPDGKSQLPVCSDRQITGYPTWTYPDGSRESGEVSLERLAEKSGCALPQ